jgi:hypothetical protein
MHLSSRQFIRSHDQSLSILRSLYIQHYTDNKNSTNRTPKRYFVRRDRRSREKSALWSRCQHRDWRYCLIHFRNSEWRERYRIISNSSKRRTFVEFSSQLIWKDELNQQEAIEHSKWDHRFDCIVMCNLMIWSMNLNSYEQIVTQLSRVFSHRCLSHDTFEFRYDNVCCRIMLWWEKRQLKFLISQREKYSYVSLNMNRH